MVVDLVDLWIALAIATNVRTTVGLAGVGPEIRRLAHVIMLITTGRHLVLVGN